MYSIKNTTDKPVRPIGIMVGTGEAPDGSSCKMVTGDIPVVLSDAEYAYAKDAIKKYEKAGMMKCEKLSTDEKADTPDDDNVEDIDELREEAKALGVKSWHVMGKDKLEEAIEKAKAGAED